MTDDAYDYYKLEDACFFSEQTNARAALRCVLGTVLVYYSIVQYSRNSVGVFTHSILPQGFPVLSYAS